MAHLWNITGGSFVPRCSSAEKHGQVIITDKEDEELIGEIITDHVARSPLPRDAVTDYDVDNYGDEIRIRVKTPRGWYLICNLQYEGKTE